MTTQAKGTFTVSGWDENTYEELENGGKLTKAHVTFGLDGDLQGEGGWEAVMCYREARRQARRLRAAGGRNLLRRPGAHVLGGRRRVGDRRAHGLARLGDGRH